MAPRSRGSMRSEMTADAFQDARFAQRPSLLHSLFELRFPMEAAMFWVHGIHQSWPHVAQHGNRKAVMFIPGFMAGDMTLAPLAGLCRWLGHKTFFTGIRSNSNCPRETLMHLERHLEHIHEDEARVVIIGQSLGGVYARELAARRPELVERVITLGSPVRLVEDSANALVVVMARMMGHLRNKEAGCLTSAKFQPPSFIRRPTAWCIGRVASIARARKRSRTSRSRRVTSGWASTAR